MYIASNGILLNLNFMAPFYGRVQRSLGDRVTAKETLLFTTKPPGHRDTHLIDLERMKG